MECRPSGSGSKSGSRSSSMPVPNNLEDHGMEEERPIAETIRFAPISVFSRNKPAPVFSIINFDKACKGTRRIQRQLEDIIGIIRVIGGTLVQTPLVDNDHNIPIVFFSNDHALNNILINDSYERLYAKGLMKDIFHENYLWEMVRSQAIPDLNLYRVEPSVFVDYDANKIIQREMKWSDLLIKIGEDFEEEGERPNDLPISSDQEMNSLDDDEDSVDSQSLLSVHPPSHIPNNSQADGDVHDVDGHEADPDENDQADDSSPIVIDSESNSPSNSPSGMELASLSGNGADGEIQAYGQSPTTPHDSLSSSVNKATRVVNPHTPKIKSTHQIASRNSLGDGMKSPGRVLTPTTPKTRSAREVDSTSTSPASTTDGLKSPARVLTPTTPKTRSGHEVASTSAASNGHGLKLRGRVVDPPTPIQSSNDDGSESADDSVGEVVFSTPPPPVNRRADAEAVGTTRSRRQSKKLFTRKEQQDMLDFVCQNREFDRIMSRDLYVEMQHKNICPGRTYHSLSNNFRKSVVPHLRRFTIEDEHKRRLLRRYNQK